MFKLNDSALPNTPTTLTGDAGQDDGQAKQPDPEAVKETVAETKEYGEDEIRDLLMQILYYKLGKDGSWEGAGSSACFDLSEEFSGYRCFAERCQSYTLPSGTEMSHRTDILIANEELGKYASIEIKHRSAVTDQFKCRSYDMLHLKNTWAGNLLGVLVYVKASTGISPEWAKVICYPFDYFFSLPVSAIHKPSAWDDLTDVLKGFMAI